MDSNFENVLEVRGISKAFPGVQALDNVSLQIKKGEVHALLGENGAGKSTLMKLLLGMYKPDCGEIFIKGTERKINNSSDALKAGIAMIHQEISLLPFQTIAENIWIGREPVDKLGLLDWKKLNAMTTQLLEDINLKFNPKTIVNHLSISGMQMIEIARAVSYNSDVIIMDEPTSALTETEVEILFDIIRNLKDKGISIIYISHKLDEIFTIADQVTVLRDGKWVDTKPIEELDNKKIISMMVGRELNQIFPKEFVSINDTALEVKNLTKKGVFNNINFSVKKGEILGVAGLMGAGRSEVMNAIFGIDKIDSGEIFIDGKKVHIKSPRDAIRNKIGMVTEDRKLLGLVLCRSVRENATYANLDKLSNGVFTNKKNEVKATQRMMSLLSIKTPSHRQKVGSLSGGNQQKVVLANWLLTEPKILILDEPTRGIDVGAKAEIHRLMCQFAKEGMAIIMISSELPEILGMSDNVLVMHGGEVKAVFTRDEVTQEKILQCAVEG